MNCRATVPTPSRISDYRLSIFKFENSGWTEFNAEWFSSFGTAIAFVGKNYGKLRTIYVIQDHHL